jgi:opine dehydrogenase
MSNKIRFCVIGAGHGGMAMAGHLAIMGFSVNLYNRTPERIWPVKLRGGIEVEGEIKGFGRLNKITSDIKEAISDVECIMVVVPATAHRDIAESLAPYLSDGQVIVLNPGRTLGALEFSQVLKWKNCNKDVIVAETQTLIYASRVINPGQVRIFRIKNSIPVASVKAYKIPEVLKILNVPYPQFVPGDNIFKTSFDNIGAVFHPAITILNTGWIEDRTEFQFYIQGCSPSVSKILEKLDYERVQVAAALGIKATTAREWLYIAYDAAGKTLYEAMHANPGYRGITAPTEINTRYITEDVPMSLVPISSLGKKFGVPTPTIDSIIHLASIISGVDYFSVGRTVEKIGIQNMSLKEIRLLAIGEE